MRKRGRVNDVKPNRRGAVDANVGRLLPAKSARRSSRRRREKMVKAGVLTLLFGSIAAAVWLGVMGVAENV